MQSSPDDSTSDVAIAESLYPFLNSSAGDVDAVLRDVQQSTRDKAREIMELRRHVCRHEGEKLVACASAMAEEFRTGGRLLAFGNGGSSTDAQDMASLFLHPGVGQRPLPAFGLTSDIAVVTALCNDVGFDVIFARQIGAFGRRHDIAVGMSTSGNSPNLLRGFDEASRRGLLTVGIAGYEGGRMAESDSIDYLFVVPSPSVHRIQEAQTTLYHALWELTLFALAEEHIPESSAMSLHAGQEIEQ
ncbi:D-sedoheptulose-7-phosphate isomerase [Haloactinomyces albus]|uniref:D-sedoheptulose 7-phosphate isomerase n=1 Tax=Haloactinomyces albus TaxID=1352928 RepID=A0AAE3ZGA1_9ACTN|nr:SIS domain-containing protein [Haloactinomyces albus]MDR7303361.1 D-sedoheptulose 7-phosphate isomerase [Haloactinomyces albus]